MEATDERSTSSRTPGEPDEVAPVPRMFVIVVFAVALAVAALIAYYGFTGQLGAGVP